MYCNYTRKGTLCSPYNQREHFGCNKTNKWKIVCCLKISCLYRISKPFWNLLQTSWGRQAYNKSYQHFQLSIGSLFEETSDDSTGYASSTICFSCGYFGFRMLDKTWCLQKLLTPISVVFIPERKSSEGIFMTPTLRHEK